MYEAPVCSAGYEMDKFGFLGDYLQDDDSSNGDSMFLTQKTPEHVAEVVSKDDSGKFDFENIFAESKSTEFT